MKTRLTLLLGSFAALAVSAGAPRLLQAVKSSSDLSLVLKGSTVAFKAADRDLARYRYRFVAYKPYVDRLYTPKGINILRDSPHDHKHHHALMYAITVNGVNFWEEYTAPGREKHRAFSGVEVGPKKAGFTENLNWRNPRTKESLLTEKRTIEIAGIAGVEATVLNWTSELSTPQGKESVTLTGSHYHGLGMRFLVSMDTGGRFFNSAGDLGPIYRGTERLGKAAWCAFTAKADGKPVTVAMFGDPSNPRGPTMWFTMTKPFCYLSATLNLHKEPLILKSRSPIKLRYGIFLWDGEVKGPVIESAYKKWTAR